MGLVRIGRQAVDPDLIACVVDCATGVRFYPLNGALPEPPEDSRPIRIILRGVLGEIRVEDDGEAGEVRRFLATLPDGGTAPSTPGGTMPSRAEVGPDDREAADAVE